MPMPCYIKFTGKKQGPIAGGVKIKGHEEKIQVQGLDQKITIPRSEQTGLPVGKRFHEGVGILKDIDESSPLLQQALSSGERLDAKLEFYRITPEGLEENHYTIEYENVVFFEYQIVVPSVLDAETKHLGHMEEFKFSYEKVTSTWNEGGISTFDSWLTPKA